MQYRGVYNLSRAILNIAVLVTQPRARQLLRSDTVSHVCFMLDIKLGSEGSEECKAESLLYQIRVWIVIVIW